MNKTREEAKFFKKTLQKHSSELLNINEIHIKKEKLLDFIEPAVE